MERFLSYVIVCFLLAGCSLTPTQKKWAGFAAGVLVVGAIAAHDADSGKPLTDSSAGLGKPLPCQPQPDGSCR